MFLRQWFAFDGNCCAVCRFHSQSARLSMRNCVHCVTAISSRFSTIHHNILSTKIKRCILLPTLTLLPTFDFLVSAKHALILPSTLWYGFLQQLCHLTIHRWTQKGWIFSNHPVILHSLLSLCYSPLLIFNFIFGKSMFQFGESPPTFSIMEITPISGLDYFTFWDCNNCCGYAFCNACLFCLQNCALSHFETWANVTVSLCKRSFKCAARCNICTLFFGQQYIDFSSFCQWVHWTSSIWNKIKQKDQGFSCMLHLAHFILPSQLETQQCVTQRWLIRLSDQQSVLPYECIILSPCSLQVSNC